jgi:hypothetical protein
METSVSDEDGDGCDIDDEDVIQNAKEKADFFRRELKKQSEDFECDTIDEVANLYEHATIMAGIQQEKILRDFMVKWLNAKGVIPEQVALKSYEESSHIRMIVNLLCFDFTLKKV